MTELGERLSPQDGLRLKETAAQLITEHPLRESGFFQYRKGPEGSWVLLEIDDPLSPKFSPCLSKVRVVWTVLDSGIATGSATLEFNDTAYDCTGWTTTALEGPLTLAALANDVVGQTFSDWGKRPRRVTDGPSCGCFLFLAKGVNVEDLSDAAVTSLTVKLYLEVECLSVCMQTGPNTLVKFTARYSREGYTVFAVDERADFSREEWLAHLDSTVKKLFKRYL